MSAKEILVPFAMVLLTVTLSSIINTKIKFAQTADHAITDIRKILLYAVFWAAQLYFAWSLVSEFVSDAPLTKRSLALILMLGFGLFHTYLMFWIQTLIRIDRELLGLVRDNFSITKTLSQNAQPK